MPVKACYATPLLHVAEIERSLKFYQLLAFETVDTDRCQPLGGLACILTAGCDVCARGRAGAVRLSLFFCICIRRIWWNFADSCSRAGSPFLP